MKTEKASEKKQKAYAAILEETGLTIKEIAEYLECNPVSLGQVMKGRKKASPFFFAALDKALCLWNKNIKIRFDTDVEKIKTRKRIDELMNKQGETYAERVAINQQVEMWREVLFFLENASEEEIYKRLKENADRLIKEGQKVVEQELADYSPKNFYLGCMGMDVTLFMEYLKSKGIWEYSQGAQE